MRVTKKKSNLNLHQIEDYEQCKTYKYLGTYWDDTINPINHLHEISKKIQFISYKLRFIRYKNTLQNNRNLFEILIMPLYSMITGCSDLYSKNQIKTCIHEIKLSFKKWCLLPRCTPNRIIHKLLGNLENRMTQDS